MRCFFLLALLAPALSACDTSSPADTVEVVAYTGPALTEADAVDPGEQPWKAASLARRVTLSQSALCGAGCAETVRLTLDGEGDSELPSFAEAVVTVKTTSGTDERDLALARVEVQDWGPDVVSGVAYPAASEDRDPIVFWAPLDVETNAP